MQGDDRWFSNRCGKFTASRFADLMARTKSGPSTSRANLIVRLALERVTGKPVETYSNAAMQRGLDLEPEAIRAYEDARMVAVERVDYVPHRYFDYVGCSPDSLVGDAGLLEVKCPSAEAKHYEALRYHSHAQEYRWQLQGQLWVTNREWVDAVSYDPRFPPGCQLAIFTVTRDEAAIASLEAACIEANKEVEEHVEWLRNHNEEV